MENAERIQTAEARRSDRIAIEFPLQLSGIDIKGKTFVEKSRTVVVSRHGARIYSRQKLGRDQELVVCCLPTGKEGEARILGELGKGPDGYSYGIAFLDPAVNIWDIEFSPAVPSERTANHIWLECMRCRGHELVDLDAMEVTVLESGQGLSRICKRCTDTTTWGTRSERQAETQKVAPTPAAASEEKPLERSLQDIRTENQRKYVRVRTKMTACIRHRDWGEEIVTTEDVSRGGFSFRSVRRYDTGALINVALPYARGDMNIFVAAVIAHRQAISGQNIMRYGLAFVK